jgi:hypothetical protein
MSVPSALFNFCGTFKGINHYDVAAITDLSLSGLNLKGLLPVCVVQQPAIAGYGFV